MAMKLTSWRQISETAFIQMEDGIEVVVSGDTFKIPKPTTRARIESTMFTGNLGYGIGAKIKRGDSFPFVPDEVETQQQNEFIQFIVRGNSTPVFLAYVFHRWNAGSQDTYVDVYNKPAMGTYYGNWEGDFDAEYQTSLFFDTNNKNTRVVPIDIILPERGIFCACEATPGTGRGTMRPISQSYVLSTINLKLDAPPTFEHSVTSTGTYYRMVSPYTVNISNAQAQYDGSIVSSKLTIGDQLVLGSGNDNLSITPNTTGYFTPKVSVTDSRGQTTEHTLPQIRVNNYEAPSILNYRIARCDTNGVLQDDGQNAILTVDYSYFNAVTNLKKPITKNGNTDISASTTWYTTYDSSTGVSDPITFPYSAPATGTIYGVIRNTFDKDLSFPISLQLLDGLDNQSSVNIQTLPPIFYTIDFLAGGKGVAFGAPSREEKFKVAMIAEFSETLTAEGKVTTSDDVEGVNGIFGNIKLKTSGHIASTTSNATASTKYAYTLNRDFKLVEGALVYVTFTKGSTYLRQLRVDSTTAKYVYTEDGQYVTGTIPVNGGILLRYDGTSYRLVSNPSTDEELLIEALGKLGWDDCIV